MTAMYPDTKPWDFTFLQYLKTPSQKNINILPQPPANSNSVLAFIDSNKDLNSFYQIIKIADMQQDLDGRLSGFTIFVPISCAGIDLLTLDKLEARKIVMLSMLPARIYQRDLVTGLFDTYLKNYQLWVDRGVLNKKSSIIMYNFNKDNGVIHSIDKLPIV